MRTDITSVRDIHEIHVLGHTCANLNGELLFIWGGTNEQVAHSAAKNSSIWIYETLTGYWRRRICSGECPPYLSGCSSCLIGQKMYIFGGHSTAQDDWLNCLYCLDLETFIWTDCGAQAQAQPTEPIRSDKNVAWSHNGKLYVFGGYGWSQVEHFLQLLDCQRDLQLVPDRRWPKFGWNNQLVEFDPSDKTWRWPRYSGKCPTARAAHSGALIGEKFFIFGGRDSQQRLNDLHTFDMQTLEWQRVAVISNESSGLLRPTIRHLLEASGEENGDAHVSIEMAQDEESSEEETDEVDDNHRQIVEEMHEVGVDEEDDDDEERAAQERVGGPSPSSSSTSLSRANIPEQPGDGLEAKSLMVGIEDHEDEDLECPRPSHMLERWSLSSTTTTATSHNNPDESDHHSSDQQLAPPSARNWVQLAQQPGSGANQAHYADPNMSPAPQASEHFQGGDHQQISRRLAGDESAQAAVAPLAPPGNDQDHATNEQRPLTPCDSVGAGDEVNQQQQRPPSLPVGRSFCSLTPISNEGMLLYGGVNSQDENLADCWIFNIALNRWTQIDYTKHNHKLMRPRLWHTGARTKQNEVVIIGGSCSDKIDEYCSDVLLISFEPRSLKRLALDTVSRAVRLKTIQRTRGIPSTLIKLIKLRKQAMALTTYRPVGDTTNQQ